MKGELRVTGIGEHAANHKIIGTCSKSRDSVARALLVMHVRVRGPDSRGDNDGVADFLSDGRDFLCRTNDAVQSALDSQLAQCDHVVLQPSLDAKVRVERMVIDRREERDPDQKGLNVLRGLMGLLDGGRHHGWAAHDVKGRHPDTVLGGFSHPKSDRVRNVVELEVQENPLSTGVLEPVDDV